jgi:hypothetical protein
MLRNIQGTLEFFISEVLVSVMFEELVVLTFRI